MKRILVLVGAGASVEFDMPSTAGLTAKVEQAVMTDGLMKMTGGDIVFQHIKRGLEGYLSSPSAVNFEQIYHCVHELLFTYPPTPGAVDEYKPIMQPFLQNKTGLNKDAVKSLCDKIVEVLYDEASSACARSPISLDPLRRFIERLRTNYITRIYTTNYDDFLLQATPDLYTGFRKGSAEPRAFDTNAYWHKGRRDSVFYLHGSVHLGYPTPGGVFDIGDLGWFDERSQALLHSSFSGGSPHRMDGTSILRTSIITGLEKLSRVQQGPFSHYYSMMAQDSMRADLIFVIGAGLADLHLNTWIAEARRRSPKPPILFVDFWPGGFEADTYAHLSQKIVNLFHRLQVHITEDIRGRRVGGWIVSKDRTAAVWDRGFQALLNAPDALELALSQLVNAPKTGSARRFMRRIYRTWAKNRG